MYENKLYISIQDHLITFKHLKQSQNFENYFLIHRWKPSDMPYILYTEAEIRKLPRVFGHPSSEALYNLLKRARPDEMTADVREFIFELTKLCDHCNKNASKSRRFKRVVGCDNLLEKAGICVLQHMNSVGLEQLQLF